MIRRLLAVLFVLTLGSRASDVAPIYLGFLERDGGKPTELSADMPPFPRVRVAFQSQDRKWTVVHGEATDSDELDASPNWYPSPLYWSVTSDGKRLGELTSTRPSSTNFYGAIALQIIKSSSLPASTMAGTKAEPEEVWPGMTPFRPLVLVTGSSWRDPEGWKRTASERALAPIDDQLRKMFHAGVPVTSGEGGETEITAFECGAHSLKVARAYRSSDGREILTIDLSGCTPPKDADFEHSITYTVLRDAGRAIALGSDLWLIDAGDFDGDGESEVIFGRSLHNHDSYVLYSRRFREHCEFSWGYH